ncbi:hypothetical protein G6F40_015404 [Rhizopus arrhizus]|nr:hypothetical protein G6F40_015404 [Rhizopus arrhizus]
MGVAGHVPAPGGSHRRAYPVPSDDRAPGHDEVAADGVLDGVGMGPSRPPGPADAGHLLQPAERAARQPEAAAPHRERPVPGCLADEAAGRPERQGKVREHR